MRLIASYQARYILAGGAGIMLAGMMLAGCSPAATEPVKVSEPLETSAPAAAPAAPQTKTVNDIDFTQYSYDLAGHTDLSIGQSRIGAIDVVRLLFAPEEGAKIIKTSTATYPLEGGEVMILSADGLADDSVRAQEFYLIFETQAGGDKLADYGLRIKCWRGDNTADWQTERCP